MAKRARFDGDAFYAALDGEGQARHCTWKQAGEECGISASTLSRMSQGKHPDVNGLCGLGSVVGDGRRPICQERRRQGRRRNPSRLSRPVSALIHG